MAGQRLLLRILFLILLSLPAGAAAARPVDEPPRTVWIIGDSLTRGLNATSEAAMYRNLLFGRLQDHYPGEVRLLYWQGMCSLARLEQRWERLEGVPPPDVLFLELGLNDVVRTPGCEHVSDDEWQALLSTVLDRFRELSPDARIVIGAIPWSGWPDGDEMRIRARAYNLWIAAEAGRRGLAFADLWSATLDRDDGLSGFDEPNPFPPDFRGDGFHPNNTGHQRLAQAFWSAYLLHYERSNLIFLPYHNRLR